MSDNEKRHRLPAMKYCPNCGARYGEIEKITHFFRDFDKKVYITDA